MPRKVGLETPVGTITSEIVAYDNPFFRVLERVVTLSDGTVREPQLLWDSIGKSFAIAVTTDEEGFSIVVEENKYAQMQRMISEATGAVKKGEDALAAAQRELLEETGYVSDEWTVLMASPLIDFADKRDGAEHFLFRAQNARKVAEPKNPDQVVLRLRYSEMLDAIRAGRVPAMSAAAFLLSLTSA